MNDRPKANQGDKKSARASKKKVLKASKKKIAKPSGTKPAEVVGKQSVPVKSKKAAVFNDDARQSGESSSLTVVAIALVVIGIAVLTYSSGFNLDDAPISETKTATAESKATAPIGGPFSLIDQEGNSVTDIDFRGQYLLIYFGYTYCPDVCHTSLQNVSDVLEKLDDKAPKVTPIFISIDPTRDTPEYLKEYASHFHPRLRALTGRPAQIAAAAKAYRVYYAKANQDKATPEDYLMDHSSAIYLIGPDGTFRASFSHGTDVETMAQRIRNILS